MDYSRAVFCHRLQAHWNNRRYNKKSCIPLTDRAWNFRNNIWSKKYCSSALKCSLLVSVFQCGANTIEGIHAALQLWFPWLKRDKGGIVRIIAWILCSTLKNNSKKVQLLMKKMKNNVKLPIKKEIIQKLHHIYQCGQRFEEIDDGKSILPSKDSNGHGILYFPDMYKEFHIALAGLFNIHSTYQLCIT